MNQHEYERLLNLDFWFISEIKSGSGLYELIYAKDIADMDYSGDNPLKAHVVNSTNVCFWDNSGSDHARCVPINRILMSGTGMTNNGMVFSDE